MNIIFLIYVAVIAYIIIPICKIVWYEKLDKDLTFLLCTNYVAIFLLTLLIGNHNYLIYSILLSLTLLILAFLLVRKIKKIFNRYQVLSIPYFCFWVYIFANLLILI